VGSVTRPPYFLSFTRVHKHDWPRKERLIACRSFVVIIVQPSLSFATIKDLDNLTIDNPHDNIGLFPLQGV